MPQSFWNTGVMRSIVMILRGKRGQSIVEFALVVPVLLLLVFGIMEGGRLLHQTIIVTEAAREGARVAVVNVNNTNINNTVKTAVNRFGGGLATTITYRNQANASVQNPVSGGTATVAVTANVQLVSPLISSLVKANPFPVSGTATMRME